MKFQVSSFKFRVGVTRRWLAVLFLVLCSLPTAFGQGTNARSERAGNGAPVGNCTVWSVGYSETYVDYSTGNHYNCQGTPPTALGTWKLNGTVGAVPSTRTISTTSPLGGGGDLSANRTLTCTTCEVTTNKDTDGTLAANSDTKYASQKATKTYVETAVAAVVPPVTSVFSRTGAVVATTNDYTWSQVNKATSSLADITTRSASDLSSGTLPDARFPATLPAASGVNLTALNGTNVASGTVADARVASALTAKTYNGLTVTANGTNTLNIAAGKTLTFNNSITLAGTDSTTMTFPSTTATIARIDAANTFQSTQTFSGDIDVGAQRVKFSQGYIKSNGSGTVTIRNSADTDYGTTVTGKLWVRDAGDNVTMTLNNTTGTVATVSAGLFTWSSSSTQSNTAQDTTISRASAGITQFGTGSTANSSGSVKAAAFLTDSNCTDSAGAAACGSASAGSVVIDAGATSVVVSTTAVTANSQVFVQYDSSLGTRLGITCNTTVALPAVTARTAATSFTITVPVAPITNAACYSYRILN